jgi:hypothetical protein
MNSRGVLWVKWCLANDRHSIDILPKTKLLKRQAEVKNTQTYPNI